MLGCSCEIIRKIDLLYALTDLVLRLAYLLPQRSLYLVSRRAIAVKLNRYGFLCPKIGETRRVRCGKCLGLCAFKRKLGIAG